MKPDVKNIVWHNLKNMPCSQGMAIQAIMTTTGGYAIKAGDFFLDDTPYLVCVLGFRNARVVAIYQDNGSKLIPVYHRAFKPVKTTP
jgi:hypothetical protein